MLLNINHIQVITSIIQSRSWSIFILAARFLLAWTFLRYGISKLTGDQFGITAAELQTPLQDLSLFRVSWYLFDQEPFRAFIGISQILCGGLLLFHRTAILGALMFLPIASTILIIDITYMPAGLAQGFAWRLSSYLLMDVLILLHYKESMAQIWSAIWHHQKLKLGLPMWAYLILPLLAICLEILIFIPKMIIGFITHPAQQWEALEQVPSYVWSLLEKLIGY